MKFKVKGLVFVGFAAAILSANAFATGDTTVTSKSYVDAKVTAIGSGTAASVFDVAEPSDTNAPSVKAVKAALAAQPGSAAYTSGDANTILVNDHQISAVTAAVADNSQKLVTGDHVFEYAAPITTTVKHTNNVAAGSATKGVYVAQDGTATEMTYSLNMTVPEAPAQNADKKVLAGDGNWKGDFTAATADAAGTNGLVPAPNATDNTKFLRGDATWQTVDVDAYTSGNANTITVSNHQISAVTDAVANDSQKLVTGDAVYEYLNGLTLPANNQGETACDANHPCALVYDGTSAAWVRMAQ